MDVAGRSRGGSRDEAERLVEAIARGERPDDALAEAGIDRAEAANRILQALERRPGARPARRHPRGRR